jgi:hypothetical protein
MRRKLLADFAWMAVLLLLLAGGLQAQAVKRLILTDGSYQAVTEWQRQGDRVRYYSAERGEWEELPAALVDWKATDAFNSERAHAAEDELKQVTADEVAARKEAALNHPEVAPGLRLPPEGGVFVFEEQGGKPELQKVESTKVEVNDHEGGNILKRSVIPIATVLQTVELKGPAAKLRLHTHAPALFVDVEDEHAPIPGDAFRLVRLEHKKGMRVVATNKSGLHGESSNEKFVHTRAEKFSGDWWKIIPLEDLAPGEYALVISSSQGDEGPQVWDFGVEK